MFRTRGSSWLALLTIALICLAASVALAQTNYEPNGTYQVNYYSNAKVEGARSGSVHIVNPGTAITKLNADGKPLNGDLCAQIYVLNDDQQEVECCGCKLSPDSERTLSINGDLLGNVINPRIDTPQGVIKIVSALPNASGVCTPDDEGLTPKPEVQSWGTHVQAEPGPRYLETEEEFSPAPLSVYELANLTNQCSAIYTSGSGKGICKCGYGD
jgi:hypothetical protein